MERRELQEVSGLQHCGGTEYTGSLYRDIQAKKPQVAGEEIQVDFLRGGPCMTVCAERSVLSGSNNGYLQLNTFLDAMDGGVCLLEVGQQIRLVYASSGFYQMLGLDEKEFDLPCTLEEMGIHSDYLAEYRQLILDSAEKGRTEKHLQRISGNGETWIWRRCKLLRLEDFPGSLPVVMEISTDVTELLETEEQLRESNERLCVAFEQMPQVLWEIDLERRSYSRFDVDTQSCDQNTAIENFPEALIENGMIHPDSAATFRAFASDLLAGSKGGNGNFIIRDQVNNYYEWVSMSYHMVFDQDGTPVKAIGIQEKLPDISGIYTAAFPRRPLPEVLRHRVLARMRVNVTVDFVEDIWMEGVNRTAWTYGKTYTEVINSGDDGLFIQGEDSEFSERFSRKGLLAAFERGEYWSSRLHRRINNGGAIRWMRDTVNLQQDPATKDVYMFVCFSDAQQRYDWENLVEGGIRKDRAGGLYDARSIGTMTEALIGQGGDRICAMAMIWITGGYERLRRRDQDKQSGSRIQDFLAVGLSFALGTDCIVGKYKDDKIIAFIPDAGSKFEVKRRIEDAFSYMRNAMNNLSDLDTLRFIAGVVVEKAENVEYDVLLLRTSYLCDLGEGAAVDAVIFPDEDEDWAWTNLRKEGQELLAEKDEMELPLSREAQSAALNCVTSMLTSTSLKNSIKSVLRGIGMYYKASRAYMLELSDDRQEVTMRYEWTGNGRHSIRQVMSGMRLDKIPLLLRCAKEKMPVFMESRGSVMKQEKCEDVWYFIAFPLKYDSGNMGFLCVENPREHVRNAALLNTLLPYILKEHRRFRNTAEEDEKIGALSKIPNLRSYMNVVYSLDSDLYSAMGAVAVDVPEFSALNSSYGFEYGSSLLFYIADTLLKIFGRGFVFRTWDAEFVVLFPNTILEVFTGRCLRLRTMLQRRYPKRIRIGYTWSDGVFEARKLVKEAKDIMACENVGEVFMEPQAYVKALEEKGAGSQKRFVAYYQPKVDMRNGSLVGAEALVRGLDADGNIIPPVQFIEKLEQNGRIRELDFIMLENVLKQLSEWKKEGLPEISISVNISRKTLFNPTVLASVLAIQSRYPEISSSQIELEVTESGGDVEKSTMAEIVKKFEEVGIRFELDDFGSRYANMSILSSVKFYTVKLDRSLVNDLPKNNISSMMVENISRICRKVGMNCVAEGVENSQQEAALLKAGCVYGQGFYYGRPMPAKQFEKEFLRKERKKEGKEV